MDHTGIDVHERESQICLLAEGGEPIERRIRTERERFVAVWRRVCHTTPPGDFTPGAAPTTYVDPDVITVDPLFNSYRQGNTPILRLWTGALWSEGPAWSGQGRYPVWSDIPNNRQLRWTEDDGRVTVFRIPSNNSNGNTFDFQGRQLSGEHLTRRVVRYEHDGSVTSTVGRTAPAATSTATSGSRAMATPAAGGSATAA